MTEESGQSGQVPVGGDRFAHPLNCAECVQRLDELLDRELSEGEVVEVNLHFSRCGDCTRRYTFQAELRRLIRTSCCEDRAPEDLRQRVRESIR